MRTAKVLILVLALTLFAPFTLSAEEKPPAQNQPAASTTLQPEGCATVEVNYDLAPASMAKGYDFFSTDISKWISQAIPRTKGGAVRKEVCWFKFNQSYTSKKAKAKIEASGGFKVANLWELHSLGQARPDLQREFSVVALGSRRRRLDGGVAEPVLDESRAKRRLIFVWWNPTNPWGSVFRFAAVRK